MSKQYQLDYNLDTTTHHPTGGFLMKQKQDGTLEGQRTGAEVFAFLTEAAINGANQRVSYDQLKGFRKVSKLLADNISTGSVEMNKTELDLIKNSIKGNRNWINSEQMELVLDQMLDKLENAAEIT